MVEPEVIESAFKQTMLVHPESKLEFCDELVYMIQNGVCEELFTRQNNVRKSIHGITSDDLLRYALYEVIKIYNAASYFYYNDREIAILVNEQEKSNYLLRAFPNIGSIQNLISIIASPDINSSVHFKSNTSDLLCLINCLVYGKYNSGEAFAQYINQYGRAKSITPSGKMKDLFQKVDKDIETVKGVRNIHINYSVLNRCMEDLMTGVQLKNCRNEYALDGSLYATQDIGNYHCTQEDAVTILVHPENPDFKFLAVSDGMGGVEYGDKASLYTMQEMTKWFCSLPREAFYYPKELEHNFHLRIMEISNEVYSQYNEAYNSVISGATFVGAIVTEEQTIVSSVGDSRAYITDGHNLKLVTRDESYVFPSNISAGQVDSQVLDDLRFCRCNNMITRCIGIPLTEIQSMIIKNEAYTRLILFSDGVTDLLSTDKIKFLSLNSRPEDLTSVLVDEALTYNAVRAWGATDEYNDIVYAGKDNATSAAFVRK